jgi:hypothetical protein
MTDDQLHYRLLDNLRDFDGASPLDQLAILRVAAGAALIAACRQRGIDPEPVVDELAGSLALASIRHGGPDALDAAVTVRALAVGRAVDLDESVPVTGMRH